MPDRANTQPLQGAWGKMPPEHTKDFLSSTNKFANVLADAAASLEVCARVLGASRA